MPRIVQVKNANKLVDAQVVFGGKQYLNAPSLVVFDKSTGEVVDSGLIVCELSDAAVNRVEVVVNPRGLTGNDYGLAPLQNSNGVGIIEAFSDVGFLTCKIQTPVLGYVNEPFAVGDEVFLRVLTLTMMVMDLTLVIINSKTLSLMTTTLQQTQDR